MEEVKEDTTTENKKTESKETEKKTGHRKRINTLKKVIVGTLLSLLLLPTILSIVALGQIHQLNTQLNQSLLILADLSVQVQEVRRISEENNNQAVDIETNASNPVEPLQQSTLEQTGEAAAPADQYEDMVKVCLTFDDGPSRNTDAILDVLASYGIKGTFFVNGHPGFEDQYRRIVEEGHTIGMHSYSHVYSDVYADINGFAMDMLQIRTYIRELTGEESIYYRFPGGSSNTVHAMDMQDCISYLEENGITYFDWNVSVGDALGYTRSVSEIVESTMAQIRALDADTIVILMHDAPGKETTVEALPILIEKIQAMDNTVIVPITEDVTPVHHVIKE